MTQPVEPTTPPAGATPTAPAPPTDPPSADDKPLGPAGQKALAEEREARKALEKQVAALAPLSKLAEALGLDPAAKPGKSEVEALAERLGKQEAELATERGLRLRLEVAAEKGMTVEQAGLLQGGTREELTAYADRLKALFPGAPTTPGTPAPDPTQGARGGVDELAAALAAAKAKGDIKEQIRLKTLITTQKR